VEHDIAASLGSLVAVRPGHTFGAPQMLVHGTVCTGDPTCAMVVAVYESDAWRGEPVIDLN
jgi:arginine decarboxylase